MIRPGYRWEMLAWLWLAYLFNQADRQVFGVVLPLLKTDLGLSDVQAGSVASIFTLALALTVPVAGYAGDRFSRRRIVFLSLLAWSCATCLAGFSAGLIFLIATRSLATAVGEGFYAPSAFSLIAEHHKETRGLAMAIHQTALYIGVIASGFVAGYLGDRYGWRSAFWIFGACGVAIAFGLGYRLRDGVAAPRAGGISASQAAGAILRIRTAWLLALGLGGLVFVNIGYLTWMPTFLRDRFSLDLANAGFSSMFYHYGAAFLGVLAGGRLADRCVGTRPRARILVQACGLLTAAPLIHLAGASSSMPAAYTALAGAGFCRGIYDSNIYASLYQVVPARYHASATGLMTAFAFVVGSAAPLALGYARQTVGLAAGLSGLALVFVLAGGVLFAAAAVTFRTDSRKALQEDALVLSER